MHVAYPVLAAHLLTSLQCGSSPPGFPQKLMLKTSFCCEKWSSISHPSFLTIIIGLPHEAVSGFSDPMLVGTLLPVKLYSFRNSEVHSMA